MVLPKYFFAMYGYTKREIYIIMELAKIEYWFEKRNALNWMLGLDPYDIKRRNK